MSSGGRTNVRSAPRIDASVVTMLDPGTVILVQPTANDWWRVRMHGSTPPIGYIREDRLQFP
jgi:SH3-like domain-containing protein